jgi:RNA polymerase sigma factor (TIGR02999 family)
MSWTNGPENRLFVVGLTGTGGPAIVASTKGVHPPVSEQPAQPVTELLARWRSGDQKALEQLVPMVYTELKELARRHLRKERPGHSLQSTGLVHEAYLRLLEQKPFDTQNRAHFLMVAARLMRQILVDHARSHGAAKRGADRRVYLDPSFLLPHERSLDVVALDDALNDLSRRDEQQGRIVELRFFGGLGYEEVAEVLNISCSTVRRDWSVAKAWLARELKKGTNGSGGAVEQG